LSHGGTALDVSSPTESAGATALSPTRRVRVGTVFGVGVGLLVWVAIVHLTQGTSDVGALDLFEVVTGSGADDASAVLVASRLPRLAAGLLVGVALGFAGTVLQSVARNPLAAPDTLGVDAGAYFAMVVTAAFGVSLPVLPAGGVAFAGGLAAAGLVLGMSAGTSGPTRLVLAGSAVGMALFSASTFLLILDPEGTVGLFAWRAGSLSQNGLSGVTQMAPFVLAAVIGCMVGGRRLDLLALGDDTASTLGIRVGWTRATLIVLAVFLTACSVAVVGPLGFVGLAAPALVRLAVARFPELNRHRVLLPLGALAGVLVVLSADVLLRALLGGQSGVEVPTGVVTSIFGAGILVWVASRYRDPGRTQSTAAVTSGVRSRRRFVVTALAAGVVVVLSGLAGMLGGDTWVLLGDLSNWANGVSSTGLTFVLDARLPRVVGALLAGAALAAAGAIVQGVSRNPLAEPGLLGITGGAGVGAVAVITFMPGAGIWTVAAAASIGALVAFVTVYALTSRGGLATDRLVLIGIGVWSGSMAVVTVILVTTSPWNLALALTWLSGSTYGRTLPQILPVLLAFTVVLPVAIVGHRRLDLMALDEDTPRLLGLALGRDRLVSLIGAALLTAAAVSAVGVIGFVGLVAPHAARALVGSHHRRVLPVAALLGAALVSVADTVGRSVIAPGQIPAGLVTALIGTPYFLWLLWKTRTPHPR
jgi:iron complex transport system permease protein